MFSFSLFSTGKIATKDPDFLKNVIQIALNRFVPGHTIKQAIRHNKQVPTPKDIYFPDYDAHRITGTPFIACRGPKSNEQLAEFFKNTIFNIRSPVKTIVSLAKTLEVKNKHFYLSNNERPDFIDYLSPEIDEDSSEEYSSDEESIFDKFDATRQHHLYKIVTSTKKMSGEFQEKIGSQFCKLGARSVTEIVTSQIEVSLLYPHKKKEHQETPRQVNATIYPVEDGSAIVLGDDDAKNKGVTKQVIWDLFIKSLHEPILIHCSRGHGRTGHLIFMLELLKHHQAIYATHNPEQAADKILEILARIRTTRPELVLNPEQFSRAIENANKVYEFALKKGYIEANKPVAESALEIIEKANTPPLLARCVMRHFMPGYG